jgi:hypothetical protein
VPHLHKNFYPIFNPFILACYDKVNDTIFIFTLWIGQMFIICPNYNFAKPLALLNLLFEAYIPLPNWYIFKKLKNTFIRLIYKNQYACPTLGKNLGHEWEQHLEYWSCGVPLKQNSELSGRLGFRVSGGVRTSGPSKSIMRMILLSEVPSNTKENLGQVFKALIHKVYFLFAVISFLSMEDP